MKQFKDKLVKFFAKETLKNLWKNDKKALIGAGLGAVVGILGTIFVKGRTSADK